MTEESEQVSFVRARIRKFAVKCFVCSKRMKKGTNAVFVVRGNAQRMHINKVCMSCIMDDDRFLKQLQEEDAQNVPQEIESV
jgi:hypothetical protein